jgi:hypothetical protein
MPVAALHEPTVGDLVRPGCSCWIASTSIKRCTGLSRTRSASSSRAVWDIGRAPLKTRGCCCVANDVRAIERLLSTLLDGHGVTEPPAAAADKFTYRRLTGQLAGVFDAALGGVPTEGMAPAKGAAVCVE